MSRKTAAEKTAAKKIIRMLEEESGDFGELVCKIDLEELICKIKDEYKIYRKPWQIGQDDNCT